jgi:hypothetical protein
MARRLTCLLAASAFLALGSAAGRAEAAPPVGGCPDGNGFELFPTSRFPPDVVELVDLNRDGFVCGKRLPTRFGGLIIDNLVP